jgi:hypothetical protein
MPARPVMPPAHHAGSCQWRGHPTGESEARGQVRRWSGDCIRCCRCAAARVSIARGGCCYAGERRRIAGARQGGILQGCCQSEGQRSQHRQGSAGRSRRGCASISSGAGQSSIQSGGEVIAAGRPELGESPTRHCLGCPYGDTFAWITQCIVAGHQAAARLQGVAVLQNLKCHHI